MKHPIIVFVFVVMSLIAYGQTIYVPSGTGGIGSSSNGNVGIGTTSPGGKLDINSAGSQLRLSGGTVAAGVWTNNADILYIADWNTGTKGLNVNMTSGNVGIGTATPSSLLHLKNTTNNVINLGFSTYYNGGAIRYTATSVNNSDQRLAFTMGGGSELFTLLNDGKISTYGALHVGTFNVGTPGNSNSMTLGSSAGVGFSNTISGLYGLYMGVSGTGRTWIQGGRSDGSAVAYDISLQAAGGNVSIGTIDPKGYKLAVAGKIISEEVVVKLQGNWPDYVFEEDYQIPSLTEIENYIEEYKHLPEVPSAKEIEGKGINLSEMNMLLLKKIEELTLHLIESNKKIENQQSQIERLNKLMNEKN